MRYVSPINHFQQDWHKVIKPGMRAYFKKTTDFYKGQALRTVNLGARWRWPLTYPGRSTPAKEQSVLSGQGVRWATQSI
jgi:hypothetical protein